MRLFLIPLLTATAASADFQDTWWGMTEENVSSYVSGAEPDDNRGRDVGNGHYKARFKAIYHLDGVRLSAALCFEEGRGLQRVALYPPDRNCPEMGLRIRDAYGRPDDIDISAPNAFGEISRELTWFHKPTGNTIRLWELGKDPIRPNICQVIYGPLVNAGEIGGF